jgi:hypothetical protein
MSAEDLAKLDQVETRVEAKGGRAKNRWWVMGTNAGIIIAVVAPLWTAFGTIRDESAKAQQAAIVAAQTAATSAQTTNDKLDDHSRRLGVLESKVAVDHDSITEMHGEIRDMYRLQFPGKSLPGQGD